MHERQDVKQPQELGLPYVFYNFITGEYSYNINDYFGADASLVDKNDLDDTNKYFEKTVKGEYKLIELRAGCVKNVIMLHKFIKYPVFWKSTNAALQFIVENKSGEFIYSPWISMGDFVGMSREGLHGFERICLSSANFSMTCLMPYIFALIEQGTIKSKMDDYNTDKIDLTQEPEKPKIASFLRPPGIFVDFFNSEQKRRFLECDYCRNWKKCHDLGINAKDCEASEFLLTGIGDEGLDTAKIKRRVINGEIVKDGSSVIITLKKGFKPEIVDAWLKYYKVREW
ncbi:MAG: hypothetical protein FWC61_00640 [Proteobacteria bacterium]|nr:hypothetical protein [Pseudomonadota bacterium]